MRRCPTPLFREPFGGFAAEPAASNVQLFSGSGASGGKLMLVSSKQDGMWRSKLSCPSGRITHQAHFSVWRHQADIGELCTSLCGNVRFEVCLHPSTANAFGVGQRPFVGQGFISTAMASAMRGQPIRIFGKKGLFAITFTLASLAAGIVRILEHGRLSETHNRIRGGTFQYRRD